MGKEVTIVGKEDGYVAIGELDHTGRIYLHIRHIDGALVGATVPSTVQVKIRRDSVEVIEGYRYDLLQEYAARTQAALAWQSDRQHAVAGFRLAAALKVEQQVATATRKWERDHPKPSQEVDTQPRPQPEPEPAGEGPVTSREAQREEADTGSGYSGYDPNEPEPFTIGNRIIVKETFDLGIVTEITEGGGLLVRLDNEAGETLFETGELEAQQEA